MSCCWNDWLSCWPGMSTAGTSSDSWSVARQQRAVERGAGGGGGVLGLRDCDRSMHGGATRRHPCLVACPHSTNLLSPVGTTLGAGEARSWGRESFSSGRGPSRELEASPGALGCCCAHVLRSVAMIAGAAAAACGGSAGCLLASCVAPPHALRRCRGCAQVGRPHWHWVQRGCLHCLRAHQLAMCS